MKQQKIIFIIGLLVLISPFLGLPQVFIDWTLAILGICLIIFSINFRIMAKQNEREQSAFIESDVRSNSEINPEVIEQGEEFENEIMRNQNE